MTNTPHIDDYRIPSSDSEQLSRTERAPVFGSVAESTLAEALRHAVPRHELDPTAIDRNRIEFGATALQTVAAEPVVERQTPLMDPRDLYAFSFYTTTFREAALKESGDQLDTAA
ncbi:MAG TPA: hypothetical protein PKV96_01670 [Candidatus Saccharimonas sp.]|nr:hypothetical protein [Candidatus Saccharimonas sp.]